MRVLDFGCFVAGRYVLDPRSWILVFGRFLDVCLVSGFSFLALRVLLETLGALNGLGSRRSLRGLRQIMAECFKGCFVGGPMLGYVLRIYFQAMGETWGLRKGNGRAFCAKRSEREQGRDIAQNKVQV